ncbi:MAG: MarR family transcriptional regulator [Acidimicrobiales bacterium]|nr:MarR family transcriptional regulator [Acidimicrobiales bacterium]
MANTAFVHAVGQRLGLNPTDFDCVDLLDSAGPLTPGQLAEHTGLTTGAVSGIVDRLETAGWVTRTRDPGDGRRVLVELAHTRHAEVLPHYRNVLATLDQLTRRIDASTQRAVVDVLDELATTFEDETVRLRAEARRARGALRQR